MVFEQFIRYAGLAVGLMVFEQFIRYPALAVGLMVFEKLIRYAGLAVGLKPSASGCEGRLRGLERMMYSKTISPRLGDAKPAGAGESGVCIQRPSCPRRRGEDVPPLLQGACVPPGVNSYYTFTLPQAARSTRVRKSRTASSRLMAPERMR